MSVEGRHLALGILLEHVADGITAVYPYRGEPDVELLIEGSIPRLTLRAAYSGTLGRPPDVLKNVRVRSELIAGRPRLSISVEGSALLIDGHRMLGAVADRIQVDGLNPLLAVNETLRQWREVLASRERMSSEKEVGLFGELLVLEALVATGASSAEEAWRGAANEEHDFGLRNLDLEVKTTTTERRQHWISSITQLVPTPDRKLMLCSLQLTRAGEAGRTLTGLIDSIRGAIGSADVDKKLARSGWDDAAADLFVERWHLRSAPAAFVVNDRFPAITPAVLRSRLVDSADIIDVRYRLDLSDREPDPVADVATQRAFAHLTSDWRSDARQQ